MTSESSNIVNLRDTLPPLQPADAAPLAAPVAASRRAASPLGAKAIVAMFVGVVAVAIAYLGYTGQWPNLPVTPPSTSGDGALASALPVTPPAPSQTAPTVSHSAMPTRDVLYSINAPDTPESFESMHTSVIETANAPTVAHEAFPQASVARNIQAEPQVPVSPGPSTSSRNTTTNVGNDASLAFQNQARIEAIEGYIIDMLTVIESHKTELRAMQASLDKNTAAIDQQMQRVAALLTQSTTPKSDSPAKPTTTSDSRRIEMPFRVTSIRQFGEALSIRIEDARGASRLMVQGQQLVGWQLVKVEPDHRRATFMHIDSQHHLEAAL